MTDKAKTTAAVCTLEQLGYAYHGGEQWKPPLGKAPDFGLVNTLRDRISELQAELEAVGAGGVQALSAGTVDPSITLDFKQATELLAMFDGEPGLVTLQHGGSKCHSGPGLYAWYSDLPEEGADFLGAEPDDEASPTPPAEQQSGMADVSTAEREALQSTGVLHPQPTSERPIPIAPRPAEQQAARCSYCDGTGDVHSIDGEWRGICTECEAGSALRQAAPKAAPGEPSDAQVWAAMQAFSKHDSNSEGMRAALIAGAAPQQEAQEPVRLSSAVLEYLKEGVESATQCNDEDADQDFADKLLLLMHTPLYTAPQPAAPQAAPAQNPVGYVDERTIEWLANARSTHSNITTKIEKSRSFERPLAIYTAPQAAPAVDERISAIEQAIRDYHYALDTRQHGGLAENHAFNAICNAMGMHWSQGKEAKHRAALAAQKGTP